MRPRPFLRLVRPTRFGGAPVLAAVVAAGAPIGAAGQVSTSSDRAAAAVAVAAELDALPWGATCVEWAASTAGASCEAFRGSGHWTRLDDEWCHRGTASDRVGTPFFHALPYASPDPPPPRCVLQQYHASIEAGSATAPGIHAELARRIDARLGPSGDPGDVSEGGSASWEDVRRWETDSLVVLLYRDPPTRWGDGEVGLIARGRPLVEAMELEDGHTWRRRPDPHATAAAEVLASRGPELAAWVAGTEGAGPVPHDAAVAGLVALLDDAEAAGGERRAALLFAADHLAGRVASAIDPSPEPDSTAPEPWAMTEPAVEALRALGLEVGWTPLGWSWVYERNLLFRLVDEHADTPWGERAAAILIRYGRDTSGMCAAGSDRFRAVIEHGEAFLERWPDSPFRKDVVLALAEAYETWFSVSRASPGDTYVMDPDEYAEGAETARLRAVDLYRELLGSEAPGGWLAARQLPRLELGIDTNQRAYYCVYD